MNNATHYAYVNNVREYFKLYFDLHTNIPRCSKLKNGAWFLMKDMDLSGLTMIEVRK
jgi:hypothetical protein